MNEAETRAEHIDPALKEAGWGVVDGSRVLREHPISPGRIEAFGRRGKSLPADYVLVYRNRKLGVIEAKAWDKPLTEGVGQAKDYAGKLSVRFTYATNGQGIYGIDMETGDEGDIASYPSPQALWDLTFAVLADRGVGALIITHYPRELEGRPVRAWALPCRCASSPMRVAKAPALIGRGMTSWAPASSPTTTPPRSACSSRP